MKKTNELKAGSILSYVNLAIGCIIPLLYTPIMLKLLGQEEYGLYALSNSVVGYLSLLNFGMGSAVIRYITRYRADGQTDKVRKTLGLFVVIYSCLALVVCICGGVLIQFVGVLFGKGLTPKEIEKLRVLVLVMTGSTAISFPIGVLSSVTIIYERYLFNKLVNIAQTILLPVLNLAILFSGGGSVGLALVGVVIQLTNAVIYSGYNIRKLDVYPVFRDIPVSLLKEMVVFSAFVFLSTIVDMLYWATDKVLIGAVIGTAAVAIYNVGGTFTSMLQSMAHAISSVFAPRVNIMVAKQEPMEQFSELLIRIGRLQYLVVSLVLSGYIVFGRVFIQLWAGPEYEQAYYIGLLTMIPLSVPLIQNIAFTTILAQNKHQFRSVLFAIIAVLNVVTTWVVLPKFGIIGAAVCTAVAYTLGQGIIMNVYYHKVIGLDIPGFWRNIGKMSLVPGGMILGWMIMVNQVLQITSLAWFCVWAACYSIVFLGLSWLVSLNQYEKNMLSGLVGKVFSIVKTKY